MRFDPARTYPHPVLRPGSRDYLRVEFEVDVDLQRIPNTTEIGLSAIMRLSDPDLRRLIDEGKAKYVLLISSPKTQYRAALCSSTPEIKASFEDGYIADRVEFSPLVICTQALKDLRATNWHQDYADLGFDISTGDILAIDYTKEYWIDTAEETPVSSIIRLDRSDRVPDGQWNCRLDAHKIVLEMSRNDYDRFLVVRKKSNSTRDVAYLMNSIYFPALIWILENADRNPEAYADLRWYRALNARLEEQKCRLIGEGRNPNRLRDAQALLRQPFERLLLRMQEVET